MPKVIKPSNPFTNVCWLRFNNIFCAATNFWLHRQFSGSIQKRRNDGMASGATAAGLF